MVDNVPVAAECNICQMLEQLDPATILWEDDHWVCASLMDVPGWTLVMTKRHAEGIWGLSDEEAVRFGPMMRDLAGKVKDVTGAERVHFAAMGEVVLHYHNAILPRLPGQTPVWDSMALVARGQADANPDAAAKMNVQLRERFTQPSSTIPVH